MLGYVGIFNLLSNLIKKPAEPGPEPSAEQPVSFTPYAAQKPALGAQGHGAVKDENTPIYQSLAMTEELRDALFPKSPQMVSAIFERKAAPEEQKPEGMPKVIYVGEGEPGGIPKVIYVRVQEEKVYPII
jgi:hypothetical protein